MLEGVKLCFIFNEVAVTKRSSFQLDYMALSLSQGSGDSVSAVLSSFDCYVVILITRRHIDNDLSII